MSDAVRVRLENKNPLMTSPIKKLFNAELFIDRKQGFKYKNG